MATESTEAGAFYRAESISAAVDLLQEHDAVLVAGGQSLMPLLRQGLIDRSVIVDISGIDDHREIVVIDDELQIGALVTHRSLVESDTVAGPWRALSETAKEIGDPQVRNWGTIGGGVAHADPSLDYPPTLSVLDATIVYTDGDTDQTVSVDDFYLGQYVTVLDEHEIITAIQIPKPPSGSGVAFEKFAWRQGDMSLVNAAARITTDGEVVTDARLCVGAMGPVPIRLRDLEADLVGRGVNSEGGWPEVAARVPEFTEPVPEAHASVGYKNRVAENLTRKVLERASRRAVEAVE